MRRTNRAETRHRKPSAGRIRNADSAVVPLQELVASHNLHAKKAVEHMIKTTAVIYQMHGADGAFKAMPRPQTTACLP